MKKVDLKDIRKVEIVHECYKYSNTVVCSINDYIDVINNLTLKHNVKILEINFYK